MTKQDYISPYDDRDTDFIYDQLANENVIEPIETIEQIDELDGIILDAIKEFNDSILNDESIDDDEDMDYQDLRSDQYFHITECVRKRFSKAIKED